MTRLGWSSIRHRRRSINVTSNDPSVIGKLPLAYSIVSGAVSLPVWIGVTLGWVTSSTIQLEDGLLIPGQGESKDTCIQEASRTMSLPTLTTD